METLFTSLSEAVGATPLVALAASGVWGVLSIVLSPCHLASIPLVIGYIANQDASAARRPLRLALAFAAGILVSIAFIGAITAAAGRIAGDVGPIGGYAVAAVFLVVGLHLAGVITLPTPSAARGRLARGGAIGALLLGLVFGVALGPCTFAFMAPVLAAAFDAAAASPLLAVGLLASYGIGHCSVIAAAGASTSRVERWLAWGERTRGLERLRRLSGILVIVAGLYLLYTA